MLSSIYQKMFRLVAIASALLFLAALSSAQALRTRPANLSGQGQLEQSQAQRIGPGSLTLWVGTRDLVAPQSNDITGRIADFLTSQGLRFTFLQERLAEGRASDLNGKHHLALARLEAGALQPARLDSLPQRAARPSLNSKLKHNVPLAVAPGTLD